MYYLKKLWPLIPVYSYRLNTKAIDSETIDFIYLIV
jgi:hypothetical protein